MELSEFLYGFHPIISFELYVRLTLDSSVGCNGAILFTFRKKKQPLHALTRRLTD